MSLINLENFTRLPQREEWKKISSWLFPWLGCAALVGGFFWFGTQHLTEQQTADEHFWIVDYKLEKGSETRLQSRIRQYWEAVENKDWPSTRINDKPGVTLALAAWFGWNADRDIDSKIAQLNKYTVFYDPGRTQELAFAYRLPILTISALLMLLIFIVIWRIAGSGWTALIGATFFFLNPLFIGISQIINPDAFLWSTVFLSAAWWLAFLKHRKWYDALLSAFFLGLALLTKYVAVILMPFMAISALAYLFFDRKRLLEGNLIRKGELFYSIGWPLVLGSGVLLFAAGMPAAFFDHTLWRQSTIDYPGIRPILYASSGILLVLLLDGTILKGKVISWISEKLRYVERPVRIILLFSILAVISLIFINYAVGNNFLQVPDIPFDARQDKSFNEIPLFQRISLELLPVIFSLPPILLILLGASLIIGIIKKEVDPMLPIAGIFLIAFYAAVIQQGLLVQIRYSLTVYPFIILIASLGIGSILGYDKIKDWMRIVIIGLIAWASIVSIQGIKPFYFNYTSDFLPKDRLITGAWGYGGYEAAQYINAQSQNPKNLVVWSDYDGFCEFFPGKCIKDSDVKWVGDKTKRIIDYFVVTRRGLLQNTRTWAELRQLANEDPVWWLEIGGRPGNFIEIYKRLPQGNEHNF